MICNNSVAQQLSINKQNNPILRSIAGNDADLFGTRTRYIQNIGQYGDTLANYGNMGKILYAYEGLGMPVLFTSKGIIHLQRKIKGPSHEEEERMERKGMKPEEIREKTVLNDRIITLEWINANPHPEIIAENFAQGYHIYGMLQQKAKAYKKLIFKNLYPGIDAEYCFTENKKAGYEYNLIVKPGADISAVKMKYGGDIKTIKQDKNGNLIIKSDIDGIMQSIPVCYYADAAGKDENISSSFLINKNEISFNFPAIYNKKEKTLIIEPFCN